MTVTEEYLDAIDSDNNVIGRVTKKVAYQKQIPHRIVHVMVIRDDKIFIARRSNTVRYKPGCYCSSAGGHVRSGETPEQGALRELKEEIGLNGPIELVSEYFYNHEFSVHTSLFIKRFDPDSDVLSFDPNEVSGGQFYSLDEIAKLDRENSHPQLHDCIERIREVL